VARNQGARQHRVFNLDQSIVLPSGGGKAACPAPTAGSGCPGHCDHERVGKRGGGVIKGAVNGFHRVLATEGGTGSRGGRGSGVEPGALEQKDMAACA